MDEEPNRAKSVSLGLNLIGLAASLTAIMSTGGLAIFAAAAAVVFLTGSLAVSLIPDESPCERYFREGNEAAASASVEPAICPSWKQGKATTGGSRLRQAGAVAAAARRRATGID